MDVRTKLETDLAYLEEQHIKINELLSKPETATPSLKRFERKLKLMEARYHAMLAREDLDDIQIDDVNIEHLESK